MQKTETVPFWTAFRFWLKLGFISFGGPAGQIAIMHRELVDKRQWISEGRFLHALNYCMVLPGPEAQQLATYIGWLMHRTAGGLVAGLLFVLPSLLILIALSFLYVNYSHMPVASALLYGIKPAVTAIVLQAAHRIGSRTLKTPFLWIISGIAFAGIAAAQLPFPAIVAAAAMIGLMAHRIRPHWMTVKSGHGATGKASRPAIIDDDTPPPLHARFSRRRLAAVLVSCATLWIVPMALFAHHSGWNGTLAQMGLFFSKAALMTFGGAYAVLPYVWQGAVDHYRWLTPAQMIDGLALGETTPGPLIMVVAYVGYLAGHVRQVLGADAGIYNGILGATVVTWFTFLPSFLFILAGGPLVESSRNIPRLSAPLTAITAAVVGVIINLAMFFGMHVFWPEGMQGSFDSTAALIMGTALIALMRLNVGVIPVIGTCATAGWLLSLVTN